MNSQEIILKIKQSNLPVDRIIAVAGTIMGLLDLKDTNDIDLIVESELYEKLKSEGWDEHFFQDGHSVVTKDNFDIGTNWNNKAFEQHLQNSKEIEGIKYASINDLLEWKKYMNREKDQKDIEVIESFLKNNQMLRK